jgi:hypothetical protein
MRLPFKFNRFAAPSAVRCQDPSRWNLLGESRAWEGALPLSWWIVDGAENESWSRPDCGSAAPTLASLSRNVKATPADRR